MANKWYKLICKEHDLQLRGTLNGGQSFRWNVKHINGKEQWIGVFADKVWILQQTEDSILYQVYDNSKNSSSKCYEAMLKDYFRLNLNLEEHYKKWSQADPYFEKASQQFYGIRILNQDVTENIFSFICSSNNNISRISSMVEKLAKYYGKEICKIGDETYFTFPTISELNVPGVEMKLRENGFGYRAKYISKSIEMIVENGGFNWLEKLKAMKYEDAKKNLMILTGIGAKVADCICLMSLGHLESIPVDTHIYQIAARCYMPKLPKQKTVTEKIYNEISDHFRNLYGPLAGWAHTVLFCADLKKFNIDETESRGSSKKEN
ncbi:8-oxoguanine dna glycosylase [Holotrichia oblita]|uniref:8-oxoguanine dna glycosylase n=2 Tax=Holotrichia oblita TaxID=644536 RepID=A0ACB9TM80_HOLOL|nr:8-oxoguanine dna glycosylase [Holotrichia oblita]KAI4467905.1 8-oxoguanine dna glycosylase [Holotrichia oblita]